MTVQDYDVLSRCHPAVNFLFFAAAIVLTVVLVHPAYLLVSLLCGGAYYAVLRRARCIKTLGFLLIAMVLVAAVNPLFNTLGETPLFLLFGSRLHRAAIEKGDEKDRREDRSKNQYRFRFTLHALPPILRRIAECRPHCTRARSRCG